MSKENMEAMAEKWEKEFPNFSKAIRSEYLQNSIADIELFDGWIRCKTSNPKDDEQVLVTDGKEVWMGEFSKREKWSVVYDGAPPFTSNDIVAWMFKPTVLPNLFDRDKIKYISASDSDSFNYLPKQVTQFEIEMSGEEIFGFDTIEECQKECDILNSL